MQIHHWGQRIIKQNTPDMILTDVVYFTTASDIDNNYKTIVEIIVQLTRRFEPQNTETLVQGSLYHSSAVKTTNCIEICVKVPL